MADQHYNTVKDVMSGIISPNQRRMLRQTHVQQIYDSDHANLNASLVSSDRFPSSSKNVDFRQFRGGREVIDDVKMFNSSRNEEISKMAGPNETADLRASLDMGNSHARNKTAHTLQTIYQTSSMSPNSTLNTSFRLKKQRNKSSRANATSKNVSMLQNNNYFQGSALDFMASMASNVSRSELQNKLNVARKQGSETGQRAQKDQKSPSNLNSKHEMNDFKDILSAAFSLQNDIQSKPLKVDEKERTFKGLKTDQKQQVVHLHQHSTLKVEQLHLHQPNMKHVTKVNLAERPLYDKVGNPKPTKAAIKTQYDQTTAFTTPQNQSAFYRRGQNQQELLKFTDMIYSTNTNGQSHSQGKKIKQLKENVLGSQRQKSVAIIKMNATNDKKKRIQSSKLRLRELNPFNEKYRAHLIQQVPQRNDASTTFQGVESNKDVSVKLQQRKWRVVRPSSQDKHSNDVISINNKSSMNETIINSKSRRSDKLNESQANENKHESDKTKSSKKKRIVNRRDKVPSDFRQESEFVPPLQLTSRLSHHDHQNKSSEKLSIKEEEKKNNESPDEVKKLHNFAQVARAKKTQQHMPVPHLRLTSLYDYTEGARLSVASSNKQSKKEHETVSVSNSYAPNIQSIDDPAQIKSDAVCKEEKKEDKPIVKSLEKRQKPGAIQIVGISDKEIVNAVPSVPSYHKQFSDQGSPQTVKNKGNISVRSKSSRNFFPVKKKSSKDIAKDIPSKPRLSKTGISSLYLDELNKPKQFDVVQTEAIKTKKTQLLDSKAMRSVSDKSDCSANSRQSMLNIKKGMEHMIHKVLDALDNTDRKHALQSEHQKISFVKKLAKKMTLDQKKQKKSRDQKRESYKGIRACTMDQDESKISDDSSQISRSCSEIDMDSVSSNRQFQGSSHEGTIPNIQIDMIHQDSHKHRLNQDSISDLHEIRSCYTTQRQRHKMQPKEGDNQLILNLNRIFSVDQDLYGRRSANLRPISNILFQEKRKQKVLQQPSIEEINPSSISSRKERRYDDDDQDIKDDLLSLIEQYKPETSVITSEDGDFSPLNFKRGKTSVDKFIEDRKLDDTDDVRLDFKPLIVDNVSPTKLRSDGLESCSCVQNWVHFTGASEYVEINRQTKIIFGRLQIAMEANQVLLSTTAEFFNYDQTPGSIPSVAKPFIKARSTKDRKDFSEINSQTFDIKYSSKLSMIMQPSKTKQSNTLAFGQLSSQIATQPQRRGSSNNRRSMFQKGGAAAATTASFAPRLMLTLEKVGTLLKKKRSDSIKNSKFPLTTADAHKRLREMKEQERQLKHFIEVVSAHKELEDKIEHVFSLISRKQANRQLNRARPRKQQFLMHKLHSYLDCSTQITPLKKPSQEPDFNQTMPKNVANTLAYNQPLKSNGNQNQLPPLSQKLLNQLDKSFDQFKLMEKIECRYFLNVLDERNQELLEIPGIEPHVTISEFVNANKLVEAWGCEFHVPEPPNKSIQQTYTLKTDIFRMGREIKKANLDESSRDSYSVDLSSEEEELPHFKNISKQRQWRKKHFIHLRQIIKNWKKKSGRPRRVLDERVEQLFAILNKGLFDKIKLDREDGLYNNLIEHSNFIQIFKRKTNHREKGRLMQNFERNNQVVSFSRIEKPNIPSAPISYYLFVSDTRFFAKKRLYPEKNAIKTFELLWKNCHMSFQ